MRDSFGAACAARNFAPRRQPDTSTGSLHFCVRRRLMSRIATGHSVPYDARPGSPGFDAEVTHATQKRAPRGRMLSRSPVSGERASLRRLASNAARAWLAATKSSVRSSVATIRVRAFLVADFKNCCLLSGEFDGSGRHYFFQRVTTPSDFH